MNGMSSSRPRQNVTHTTTAHRSAPVQQGAAEIVLAQCTGFLDAAGSRAAMDDAARAELEDVITGMASSGLRTLCLSLRELPRERGLPDGYLEAPPDEDLTLCAIVGIKVAPLRKSRSEYSF